MGFKSCDIYLLLIDLQYGESKIGLSATHEEYRLARKKGLPILVFILGLDNRRDAGREKKTKEFFAEVKADGYKYVRFHDREDLKGVVRIALLQVLGSHFHQQASEAESEEGEHLIDVASPFEGEPMPDVPASSLRAKILAPFVRAVRQRHGDSLGSDTGKGALVSRGLAIAQRGQKPHLTRAAFLLFASRPASRFPQCEILADAYDEPKISGKPKGQLTIDAPILAALDQALKFVDYQTAHPHRVVGLNDVRLNEYSTRGLREALVNALAHRDYADATRKLMLRVFSDRVEIASPGYPPKPITLAKLRKGNYRPCSRNPLISQTLALLGHMEQRGTGFARMRDAMLDHGLDEPTYAEHDGYFVVTFRGPDGDYKRLRVPAGAASGPVTPAIEARLNVRQRKILKRALEHGSVTTGWCIKTLSVARDTAHRDLLSLVEEGVLVPRGAGRAARYEPVGGGPAT